MRWPLVTTTTGWRTLSGHLRKAVNWGPPSYRGSQMTIPASVAAWPEPSRGFSPNPRRCWRSGQPAFRRLGTRWTQPEAQGPNSDVVELLAGHADELRELAAESVRFDSVWESLVELVGKHRDVFSDHHSLEPYARAVDDVRPCGESAQDAEELLEKIDGQLRLLARTAEDLRKTPAAMAEANAEQRNQLIGEINKLRDNEAHICSDTERLLGELFGGFQLDIEAEAFDTSTDTAGSHARTVGAEIHSTAVATENLDAPVSEHVGDDAQVQPQQVDDGAASHRGGVGGDRIGRTPFETGEGLDSDGGSTEPRDTACEESDVSPDSGSTAHAQEAASQPTEPSGPPAAAIRHTENHETLSGRASPKDDGPNSSEVATDALVHEAGPLTESEAFEAMLSSGRFARAYWLTYADRSIGGPKSAWCACRRRLHRTGKRLSWRIDPLLRCLGVQGHLERR